MIADQKMKKQQMLKPKAVKTPRAAPANKRRALLDAAAKYFGQRGFEGTSMRDIAAEVGMLSGSMYYHFASKDALLLAVHQEGVQHIKEAVERAVQKAPANPWDRLEEACVGHLDALVGGNEYAQVVTPQFTHALPAKLRKRLIEQRDSYEKMFAALVDALALPRGVSARYLRLTLLGSLNWTLTWYHAGGDSPSQIARKMVQLFRIRLDQSSIDT
ncbi:MAG: TetR/AcrR family transcriptional regulator [Steroidobacteraceae bacterium]